MTHQYINSIVEQSEIDSVYRVASKQLRPNRNGDLYLQVELYDRTGRVTARVWNATENIYKGFEAGDYVRVLGKAQIFQGEMQIIGRKVLRAQPGSFNEEDYLKLACIDVDKLLVKLREMVRSVTNESLKNLLDCFLIDEKFMQKFSDAPAGVKNHHAYPGGLLQHTVTIMEMALKTAALYPCIDRDLLLTGAFIHDISKIDEMIYDGELIYSDSGQLLGHLVMGIEKLNDKIAECEKMSGEPIPEDTKIRLKHMIISHHGEYEFGSPKLPMTIEAITLHYLDSLDSRIVAFDQLIRDDLNQDSNWTHYVPVFMRKIYKGQQEPQ